MWGRDAVLLAAVGAVPAALGGLVSFFWRARRVPQEGAARLAFLDGLVLASLIGIAVIGLRPGLGETPDWQQWNFVPFREVIESLSEPDWVIQIAFANLLGNVLIYVPWGVVASFRFRRVGILLFLVVTVAISLSIEIAQALEATGRVSDVTDVIMNTLGGGAAYTVARVIAARRSQPTA